ncbi:GtrA family protein, partial [Rhodococcus enclensis]|nr:GtrA family protein [Rhodococcus qingshengii]
MTEDIASPENPGPLLRVVKHQPIAFAIVGVANTAIGYVLFVVWSLILPNQHPYQGAVIGAYAIPALFAFVL